MCARAAGGINSLFSLVCRQQCMSKLKRYPVPNIGKIPAASAAVLVPLCRVNGVPSLLYTVRSLNLRLNRGEVSFPGGKRDEEETPIETALRETEEEIGLSSDKLCVWGHGPAFPGRDNKILVTPVIASISDLSDTDLDVNDDEVAEVFTVAIEVLCNPNNQYCTQFSNGYLLPVFVADRYKIWGLTAYLTHVFLSCALSKDVYNNESMKRKNIINS